MLQKGWNLIKKKPAWVALGLTIILTAMNIVFLVSAFQKDQQAEALDEQVKALEASLEQLREAESEGLQSLEDELASAQTHLASLEISFPEIGTAFDLYRRGFDLARMSSIELTGIRRMGGTTQSTVVGTLDITTYEVTSVGDFRECLSFLSRLESEGLQTLALDHILIDPSSFVCNFDVIVASATVLDAP